MTTPNPSPVVWRHMGTSNHKVEPMELKGTDQWRCAKCGQPLRMR